MVKIDGWNDLGCIKISFSSEGNALAELSTCDAAEAVLDAETCRVLAANLNCMAELLDARA